MGEVREWAVSDIPCVANVMLRLQDMVPWGSEYPATYNDHIKWLTTKYMDYTSMVFLNIQDDVCVGACGVTCELSMYPPCIKMMYEWCLWGESAKDVSKTWVEAKKWGRSRGALYAKRSILHANRETIKWEKL